MPEIQNAERKAKAWESRLRRKAKRFGYRVVKIRRLPGESFEDDRYNLVRDADGTFANLPTVPFSLWDLSEWLREDEEAQAS